MRMGTERKKYVASIEEEINGSTYTRVIAENDTLEGLLNDDKVKNLWDAVAKVGYTNDLQKLTEMVNSDFAQQVLAQGYRGAYCTTLIIDRNTSLGE